MMAAKNKKEPTMSDKKKNAAKKLSKKQLKKQAKKQEKAVRKAAKKLAKKLAPGKAKPSKAKAAKTGKAVASGAASFQLNLGTCPFCSKHCPLAKPKCGKGRAVARKKRARLTGDAAA